MTNNKTDFSPSLFPHITIPQQISGKRKFHYVNSKVLSHKGNPGIPAGAAVGHAKGFSAA